MKVSQTVEMKYDRFYVGYGYCEFKDSDLNQVSIRLTDDNILEMYDDLKRKRERILKERADEAAELASQTQENENE